MFVYYFAVFFSYLHSIFLHTGNISQYLYYGVMEIFFHNANLITNPFCEQEVSLSINNVATNIFI